MHGFDWRGFFFFFTLFLDSWIIVASAGQVESLFLVSII